MSSKYIYKFLNCAHVPAFDTRDFFLTYEIHFFLDFTIDMHVKESFILYHKHRYDKINNTANRDSESDCNQ